MYSEVRQIGMPLIHQTQGINPAPSKTAISLGELVTDINVVIDAVDDTTNFLPWTTESCCRYNRLIGSLAKRQTNHRYPLLIVIVVVGGFLIISVSVAEVSAQLWPLGKAHHIRSREPDKAGLIMWLWVVEWILMVKERGWVNSFGVKFLTGWLEKGDSMKNYERYPVGWCLCIYITARLMRAKWQLAETSESWSREACCNTDLRRMLHDTDFMLLVCNWRCKWDVRQ